MFQKLKNNGDNMLIRAYFEPMNDDVFYRRKELLEQFVRNYSYYISSYHRENSSKEGNYREELYQLIMDSRRNDIILVEKIGELTHLGENHWRILKKKIENNKLWIVSLDIPVSWQTLSVKEISQCNSIVTNEITNIQNIILGLFTCMTRKYISHHYQKNNGQIRLRDKRHNDIANKKRYLGVIFYRQVKKLSIRETAHLTGYSASQVCRIQNLYKNFKFE
jgi:hypothetical protein